MFSSFFSCCFKLFQSKDDFKRTSLALKRLEDCGGALPAIKNLKISTKRMRTLSFFSRFLVEEIMSPYPVNLEDFIIDQFIGKGAFGQVFLVTNAKNKQKYAMKVVKREIYHPEKEKNREFLEKNIMKYGEHPFIVKLRFSFQTEKKIYLIMDYIEGGQLCKQLSQYNKFTEEVARFYSIEVILALEYLHDTLQIVYRDLKPENILLDATGHIKITDFGLSKLKKNSYTFCGTANYVAPEVLLNCGHKEPVDIWGFGCLLFEMLCGRSPFEGKTTNDIFKQILESEPIFPSNMSIAARNLIETCLMKNPSKRISLQKIKNHEFFKGVKWNEYLEKKIMPPLKIDQNAVEKEKIDSTLKNEHFYKKFNNEGKSEDMAETYNLDL